MMLCIAACAFGSVPTVRTSLPVTLTPEDAIGRKGPWHSSCVHRAVLKRKRRSRGDDVIHVWTRSGPV
jgi:hypothetical protein